MMSPENHALLQQDLERGPLVYHADLATRTPGELSEMAYTAVTLHDPDAPDYVAAAVAAYVATLNDDQRRALRTEYARMDMASSRVASRRAA